MGILIEPKFNFPSIYAEPFNILTNNSEITNVTSFSGRNTGKSYNYYQIAVIVSFKEKDNNILILRATKTQIKNSSFSLMSNIINSMNLSQFFKFRYKAMQIENLVTGSIIYFDGVEDDPERIKGFTPRNDKISMVIFEEFTELSSYYPIGIAVETLIRFKGSESNKGTIKFVKIGNPSRWNSHWSWDIIEVDKNNPKAKVYQPVWYDIKNYLQKHTIAYIENLKETNPRYYAWAYEGKRMSYEGLVYEKFSQDCLIDINEFEGKQPVSLICGLDPASKRDKTAFVISVLFNTGQLVVMDMWCYNPKLEDRLPLSPSEQGERIVKFLNDWVFHKDNIQYRFLPKYIIVDSASGGLDIELRNNYGKHFEVLTVDKKERLTDIARNQNALATGRLRFKKNVDNLQELFDELSMMVWRDKYISKELKVIKSTNLTIGEDDCHDAMTYAITFALTNARFMKYNADLLNINY